MSVSTHPRPPKRRMGGATLAIAGAILLTGLVLAFGPSVAQGSTGSSGNQAGSGVGITMPQDPVAATSGTASGTAQRSAATEAFTACMRENGVPDFPGVTVTAAGTLQLVPGSNVNPISRTYQAAAKKCASKLPSGSALPAEPSVPTPSLPASVKIDCSGSGCPAAPTGPKAPVLPN